MLTINHTPNPLRSGCVIPSFLEAFSIKYALEYKNISSNIIVYVWVLRKFPIN